VAQASAYLRQPGLRVLTLTGPGGVGKTRLALEVARSLRPDFADGVWFISLAPVDDADLAVAMIAQTLGLIEHGDEPLGRLRRYLREREALLVLDNLEQILPIAASLASLLASCPDLNLLVTSREPMRISGEQQYPVLPLELPVDSSSQVAAIAAAPAVRLFVQRASEVEPRFGLTETNAHLVAQICARLDGLPLAIELAAARVNVLPLEALSARMDQQLTLLSRTSRDAPLRLQTMRNAVAWSYDLLTPAEQEFFRLLSAFPDGFTLEAAEAIAEVAPGGATDVLGVVTSLIEKNLLRVVHVRGITRYVMLETIRAFGAEQLLESGALLAVRRAIANWYLALLEQGYEEIWQPSQGQWLTRLEAEHDTLRAVLGWAEHQGDTEVAQRLVGHLHRFWWFRGHFAEGQAWSERALAMAGPATPLARTLALSAAGRMASALGDNDRAVQALGEALHLSRQIGEPTLIATALWRLGMAEEDRGNYQTAAALLAEAIPIFHETGDRVLEAAVRHALGVVHYEQADPGHAAALFKQAVAEFRTLDVPWLLGYALASLGKLARAEGDYARAAELYGESLSLRWEQVGDKVGVAGSLRGLASLSALTGEYERAARLYGAAESVRESIAAPAPRHHPLSQQAINLAQERLGAVAFQRAWQAGRELPLPEAVAEALLTTTSTRQQLPDATTHHQLSARELEVLAFIREGHSNRIIGERLFISESTVRTHVQGILRKLGLTSRAAAAAFAAEHAVGGATGHELARSAVEWRV
jgi:non-specific serine/threonine protein kinase